MEPLFFVAVYAPVFLADLRYKCIDSWNEISSIFHSYYNNCLEVLKTKLPQEVRKYKSFAKNQIDKSKKQVRKK